ncbi:MAG: hypothetical protein C0501_29085 [Isosphaera sp.]|nr:hypothetical protein [Isosphaera sp.]
MHAQQSSSLGLIRDFQHGSQSAAQELFDRYCDRLMRLARRRIGPRLASRVDPEDVTQSVYLTFFNRVRNHEFSFRDEDDPFKLLVRLTVYKTLRQIAHHRAGRRDPGMEVAQGGDPQGVLGRIAARRPSPEAEVALADELERLTSRLPPLARRVLSLRLQGYSTAEIADRIGSYDRKVRRVLGHVLSLARGQAGGPG